MCETDDWLECCKFLQCTHGKLCMGETFCWPPSSSIVALLIKELEGLGVIKLGTKLIRLLLMKALLTQPCGPGNKVSVIFSFLNLHSLTAGKGLFLC